MKEQQTDKVVDSGVKQTSGENNEVPQDKSSKKDFNQLVSFIDRMKNIRKQKMDAKTAWRFEFVCFVLIAIFAAKFRPENFKGQNTPLLYYYQDATVLDVRQVDSDSDKRWKVLIEYTVGTENVRKVLYYKKMPDYEAGDILELKVQTVNPERFEVEGAK